ncbi:MAG TPA: spore germination protein GerW family protein [Candidatus Aminicenantes bacterium]|nr:spore germination protein GerW family protein [Candidatus Aminicenantes bacterium]
MNAKRIAAVACGALLLGPVFLAAQPPLDKPLADFDRLVAGLKAGAVVGEPLTVQDTVIIPFAKVKFGLGGGGGGIGFGGGMGAKTVPLGFVIIEGETVRVELIPEEEKKPSLLQELLPILLDALPQIMGGKMPGMSKPQAADAPAPGTPPAVPANATLDNIKELLGEKKYPEALQTVDALLAKDPGSADLHAWKGHIMGNMAQGNPLNMMKYGLGAMQEYETALKIDPKNTDARFGRGVARLVAPQGFGGDLDGAIQDLEASLAKPTPEAHFYLGEAYKKKGLPDKAKAAYLKALALDPGYAEAKKALDELR